MSQSKQIGNDPSWWNETHSSGWDRTKEALRRDWEQTKADVSDGGQDLDQDVDDTVKQAAGKQPIPAPGTPNPSNPSSSRDSWDELEPAVRYGYGARQYYGTQGQQEWNDELETKLRGDWESIDQGSSWERVKSAVKRGWESVKRAAT